MIPRENLVADTVSSLGQKTSELEVRLSNQLVALLSEQLYQSPLKAIEELVVNAYDADAKQCRLFVPAPSDRDNRIIVVFDDGIGMTEEGLHDLWQIGRSNKRTDEIALRAQRKQIGKFGIGKLATYTLTNKLTYITRSEGIIRSVSIDFKSFKPSEETELPVRLGVRTIEDWETLIQEPAFQRICAAVGVVPTDLVSNDAISWTFVVLEDLKEFKASRLRLGNLKWVLRTAMPLRDDFELYLNGEKITSSKEDYHPVVEFNVTDLPQNRLEALVASTGEEWSVDGERLKSPSFQEGISGEVIVTQRTLTGGKSEDIRRSHGFFIRVRGRLINEDDAVFGLSPLSYTTFNRFRADLQVDDLDQVLTAPREGVEESSLKQKLEHVLKAIFYEARRRYEDYEAESAESERRKKDSERNYVNPFFVEYPVADVLVSSPFSDDGSEPDNSWMYLEVDPDEDLKLLVQQLYTTRRNKYRFEYVNRGSVNRIVRFNPKTGIFSINADHELVKNYFEQSRYLLEDFVVAEALLEIYLRENNVESRVVGEILERRDSLLRSLVFDHPYSPTQISQMLRDAASNEYDLEIALVTAARAIGFVAKHISGAGEPDGLARLADYPTGEKKITLEAKSSSGKPSLPALDFAGIQEHMRAYKVNGCLLIAPEYPGSGRGDESSVSNRARTAKISCWTVEDLARLVDATETRQLTATDLLNIVLDEFAPEDVHRAVDRLLSEPAWLSRELYRAILDAMKKLEGRLTDAPRSVEMLATEVSTFPRFGEIQVKNVEEAVRDLAGASQGAITFRDHRITIHTSIEELERRLAGILGHPGKPRRPSTFRD